MLFFLFFVLIINTDFVPMETTWECDNNFKKYQNDHILCLLKCSFNAYNMGYVVQLNLCVCVYVYVCVLFYSCAQCFCCKKCCLCFAWLWYKYSAFVSCSYKTRNMSAKLVLRYIALNVAYHKKWWFFLKLSFWCFSMWYI